jgi:hypothetical protein
VVGSGSDERGGVGKTRVWCVVHGAWEQAADSPGITILDVPLGEIRSLELLGAVTREVCERSEDKLVAGGRMHMSSSTPHQWRT